MSVSSFTQRELDVLFHVMNNSYGSAWENACERAVGVDGMTREEFAHVYTWLVTKLANMEGQP